MSRGRRRSSCRRRASSPPQAPSPSAARAMSTSSTAMAMPHSLLNGVAAATAHRDRDELDRAVVALLLQFIEPQSITLLRVVADELVPRIEERVRMSRDGGPATQQIGMA